jgi:hypothetical protein
MNIGLVIAYTIGMVVFYGLYLLPALLATYRRHPSALWIWLVNFFLGFTIIGWIACLVWVLNAKSKDGHAKEPNKQGLLIALGVFAVIGLLAGLTAKPVKPGAPATESAATASSVSSSESSQSSSSSSVGNWSYNEDADKMRGTTTKFARLSSDNDVSEEPPYSDGPMQLNLRRKAGVIDAYLTIDGQFTCSTYSDDTVSVKFDDGKVLRYACAEPDDGSPGVIFIQNASGFLAHLKSSKHMVIEVQIWQRGNQQLEYSTAGLDF